MKRRQRYIVTPDADRIAPDWLAVRINYDTVNFIYQVVDGAVQLKGVRIGLDKVMFVVYKINDKTSFLKERFYRDVHLAVSSDMNNTEN